jgi:hypothetical protein
MVNKKGASFKNSPGLRRERALAPLLYILSYALFIIFGKFSIIFENLIVSTKKKGLIALPLYFFFEINTPQNLFILFIFPVLLT